MPTPWVSRRFLPGLLSSRRQALTIVTGMRSSRASVQSPCPEPESRNGILSIPCSSSSIRRRVTANKVKHGIDFNEAMELFRDENRIEIPARTTGEPRSLVIGRIREELWSAVITYRGEQTRIISVRRSRREEVELYEG